MEFQSQDLNRFDLYCQFMGFIYFFMHQRGRAFQNVNLYYHKVLSKISQIAETTNNITD